MGASPRVVIVGAGFGGIGMAIGLLEDGADIRTGFSASDLLTPMSVSGSPNLFVLHGPNTNLAHNSIIRIPLTAVPRREGA